MEYIVYFPWPAVQNLHGLREHRVNFQLTTERNEIEIDPNFKSRSISLRDV